MEAADRRRYLLPPPAPQRGERILQTASSPLLNLKIFFDYKSVTGLYISFITSISGCLASKNYARD
mgnify:CR=1 FL=1